MKTQNTKHQAPEKRQAPSAKPFDGIVTVFIEVGTSAADGRDLKTVVVMPFCPQPGMWIIAVDGDDYRKVEEVYWSEEEGATVHLEFAERGYRRMKKLGWEEADR